MHVCRMYVIKLSWSCEAVLTLLKLLKSYAQHRHRKRLNALQKVTNQTKGSKDGKSFDVGKTEFNEAKDDDDDIEAVPLVLQIGEETERKDLHNRLRRKDRREDLTIDRQLIASSVAIFIIVIFTTVTVISVIVVIIFFIFTVVETIVRRNYHRPRLYRRYLLYICDIYHRWLNFILVFAVVVIVVT